MKRIASIDIVRGLAMVIMALDHTRDLLHVNALTADPTNLATTTPALFFTRWVTHFCAPTFVFLAGVSVWISLRKRTVHEQRWFLISRGLWLILLEFTVVTFGLWWDIHFSVFLLQVIAVIGFSFIVLGLLLQVPARILGLIGILIIALHGLAPMIPVYKGSTAETVMALLFNGGMAQLSAHTTFIVGYPLIPWLGIMLSGYGSGFLFLKSLPERKSIFLRATFVCAGLFILLRLINVYGDPVPWVSQKNSLYTLMSFLNLSKYPPSLLYCLLTLGGMFFFLWLAESLSNRMYRILEVYGKVPLFYYLLHWYILHPLMFFVLYFQGFSTKDFRPGFFFGRPEASSGLGLAGIYTCWICIVIILYPVCLWFGAYKAQHPNKRWLRYV